MDKDLDKGWVKIYRKMLDNPVVFKDADHLAVWMYLLLSATHKDHPTMYGGKKITLRPGQLITGRKKISEKTGVNEYKVMRILKRFENEQQIAQQTERYGSLISIVSWDEYQDNAQQPAQRVHNDCTLNKNGKNGKNNNSSFRAPIEPPKYKLLEPDPVIDAVPMPKEIREKFRRKT